MAQRILMFFAAPGRFRRFPIVFIYRKLLSFIEKCWFFIDFWRVCQFFLGHVWGGSVLPMRGTRLGFKSHLYPYSPYLYPYSYPYLYPSLYPYIFMMFFAGPGRFGRFSIVFHLWKIVDFYWNLWSFIDFFDGMSIFSGTCRGGGVFSQWGEHG